ncbi:major facilitator superfamily protein [Sarocladium implicatum]|nr:major facilitator superfamily protein [Sarocladium implicatum]
MTILGMANLLAPGIWGAMNSLGAGGAASPKLINAANALTFCLMVLSCFFGTVLVRYIGIKGTLVFGTLGYAPYAAGLYTNNRFGTEWLVLVGAALCGISAGVFWMSEAAIAIAYPEPWNRGKALGYWLTYRCAGPIIGGAINLGLNASRSEAGSVSYTVFLVFIAMQASGPIIALFLSPPEKVQREDGKKVQLSVAENPWYEIKATVKNFLRPKFLLLLVWIGQAVFSEAVYYTYIALWFSVRSRALASFISGIVAVISGNLLGQWLDSKRLSHRLKSRGAFWFIAITQGAWWVWITVNVTRFRQTRPVYDWSSPGFGAAFGVYVFLTVGFQLNYMFLYVFVTNLAESEVEVVRYAALLRGTESAWQAVSYGLTSIPIFGEVGAVYINFGLWAVGLAPAWLVLRQWNTERTDDAEVATDVSVAPVPSETSSQSGNEKARIANAN